MKTKGPHPRQALSATRVRSLTKPGKYADGNGLYLIVDDSGAKRWELRTVVQRRRRDIGLGGISLVSLAEARDEAASMRKIARKGGDPLADRRKSRVQVPTFKEAATIVHQEHSESWKNKKHSAQWIKTLEEYTFPLFGDRPVDQVDTPEVLNALSKIWLTKPETARRVRQRIGTVLDWAKAAGHRSGDNPINGIVKGLPKQPKNQKHHAALPYSEVNSFISDLGKADANESTRLAFEFLILTATRTSEVILAEWSEIDLEEKTWTIPAKRMKAGNIYRISLTDRCMEILERAKALSDRGQYVFPGRSENNPLSTMVFLMVIHRWPFEALPSWADLALCCRAGTRNLQDVVRKVREPPQLVSLLDRLSLVRLG